jgi:hypothetical protein
MAETIGRPMPAVAPAPAKKRSWSIVLWVAIPALLVFALPTLVLVVLGLAPTMVAAVIDRRAEKYAAYCVGGFNISGVIPYLFLLWASGDTMHALGSIVGSPFAWLAMYGAAALGWLANYWTPLIMVRVMSARDRREAAQLRRRQQQILEEWGPEVMPPSESMGA